MSEALEERLITMASLRGVPKATYARQVLERVMFGEFAMVQMMTNGRNEINPENPR